MKTNIENYLKKNRDSLDVEKPEDDRIWEGIRNDLQQKKRFLPNQFLRIAAIVLLLLGIAVIVQLTSRQNEVEEANLYAINKLLGEREQNYIEKVNFRLGKIEKLSTKEDQIITELLEELIFLDTIYNEAYNDLQKFGYEEQIVNILFDTYEKRIRILEKIIVESQKNEKNENKEYKVEL